MSKQLSNIPGHTGGWASWRDSIRFFKKYHQQKAEKQAQYGSVYKMKFFGRVISVINDAGGPGFTMVKNKKVFNSKEAWDLVLAELFPNGLMLMDGEQHKHHRSIIAEAFKRGPMEGYLETMKTIVPAHIGRWMAPNPKLFPLLKAFTLEIALQVFFGLNKDPKFDKINQAISDIVEASSALPIKLPFTKYRKGLRARKYLVNFFTELLPERRSNPKKDLFSMLLTAKNEAGASLTNQQIVDHLIFILMAAHDTTASTQTSMCYFLAKHQDWQERLRTEAQTFYAKHGDTFALSDLRELKQMDLALKETLRRYPPLVIIGRVSSAPLMYNDFAIPAGSHVSVDLDSNHHHPDVWSCPMQFDPERFTRERSEHSRCPHSYTPFGAGAHHCVGSAFAEMQIKYVMSQLLLQKAWTVPADYEAPMQPVPIQLPKDGLPVQMSTLS